MGERVREWGEELEMEMRNLEKWRWWWVVFI
jgi:hypothetical protein